VLNECIGCFLQQIQFSDRKLIQLLEIVFDGIDNLSGGSLQRTKEISRYGGHDGTEEKRWLANYQVEPGEATLIDSVEQGCARGRLPKRKGLNSYPGQSTCHQNCS
jgi:hypothetical protein